MVLDFKRFSMVLAQNFIKRFSIYNCEIQADLIGKLIRLNDLADTEDHFVNIFMR